jgi:hypothetical protein
MKLKHDLSEMRARWEKFPRHAAAEGDVFRNLESSLFNQYLNTERFN